MTEREYPHCEIVYRNPVVVVYWDRADPTDPIYRQADPRKGDYELLKRQINAKAVASRVGKVKPIPAGLYDEMVAYEEAAHGVDSKEAVHARRMRERMTRPA